MSGSDPSGTDWTDREIDLIVADYFDMLRHEIARQPYVKAHRNAALRELTGRSRGSVEFKHQNISAVLLRLGMPWISGYKPMENYQGALIDGIDRFLSADSQAFEQPVKQGGAGFAEDAAVLFEPPPKLDEIDASAPPALERLVRKFDPAERDARNRVLGKRGEERVLLAERVRLSQQGRPDLAKMVRWTSQEDGDGAGYDILSYYNSGEERLLEVKTTSGHRTTPFYLSENERALSAERPDAFRIVRLYDFARMPRAFELAPPLSKCLLLQPTIYRASLRA